jgi:apolipoprotein N-acyltransferase
MSQLERRPGWRKGGHALALLGGALHAWSLSPWCAALHLLAPPLLQSGAVCLLLWALSAPGLKPRQGAILAWLYGTAWLVGATGWTYVSLHRFGGLPAWLAGFAVVALSAALSLYMAGLGAAFVRWRTGAWWRDAALFTSCWLLAEMARAVIFTGFPWGASGYGLLATPFVKLAPWLGVYGMGACWALVMACAVLGGRRPSPVEPALRAATGAGFNALGRVAGVAVAVACLLALWLAPVRNFTQRHGEPLSVTLLQGNVPQEEKFVAEMQVPMLVWHARQLSQAPGKLVVAPETAIPLLPSQLPERYWEHMLATFGPGTGRYALVGVPLGDFEAGYTNSVAGLSAQMARSQAGFYRYNKHHLVPFGEFIPFGFHWFVQMMNMPLGDFMRGPLAAPPFEVEGQRIGPNICYEDLYGEELAARFKDESQAPTILANVSNLAWFGEQVAISQHLQIARLRSLEFQLPTLRATNSGATVIINELGQVTHELPWNTRGALQGVVQGRAGVTPFAWWASRWGLWPMGLLALLLTGLSQWGSRPAASSRSVSVGRG